MANTISINSDMTKLIFISGSTTLELPLAGDGVILRLAGGNIGADPASSPIPGSDFVVSTENAIWTVCFSQTNNKVFFIGIDDVDMSITNPVGDQFDLSEQRLNIRRSENTLVATAGV